MIQGTIEDIAFGGEGVIKSPDGVIFVPYTAPSDIIELTLTKKKKRHAFGKMTKLLQESPSRTTPVCPYYGTCGGCTLQHLNYPTQLAYKRKFVQDSLTRIGKINIQVPPVHPAEKLLHYRRHINLRLIKKEQHFQATYTQNDNITPLAITSCSLFSQDTTLSHLQTLCSSLSNLDIQEASVRLIKEDTKVFLAFTFTPIIPENFAILAEQYLSLHPHISGILAKTPHNTLTFGNCDTTLQLDNLTIHYSPYGFIQTHPQVMTKLYAAIQKMVSPTSKQILDLYCGVGITSLLLAKSHKKVLGIEAHRETVELAKKNAEENNAQIDFKQARVEELLPQLLQDNHFDTVLLNPPRTGLAPTVLQHLLNAKIPEILYVSCMPPTLARDLQLLCNNAYQIKEMQLFDMFPQTTHVETLVHLIPR